MSKSMFIYPCGVPTRVEFKGGTLSNKFHGQFTTDDEEIQKGIESHPDFGLINTHKMYLSDILGADGQAVWGEEATTQDSTKKELKITLPVFDPIDTPEDTIELPKIPTGFKEVKAILISKHGVAPDELKNFKQVQKKIKDLNLDYVL